MKILKITLSLFLVYYASSGQKISRVLEALEDKNYEKAKNQIEKLTEDYATHPFTHLATGLFYLQSENPAYNPQKAYASLVNAKNNWYSLSLKEKEKAYEKNKLDTAFIAQSIDKLLNAEFQKNLQKKSIEDLEKFAKDYPKTDQANKAMEEVYVLAYQKAETANNIDAYFVFRQKYPNAPQVLQAQSKIYELAFAQAEQTHTAEAYQIFLQKYPNAPQKEEAKQRAEKLQYENFTKRGTQAELELYIQKYPHSPYVDDARRRLSASYLKDTKIMVSEPIAPTTEQNYLYATLEIWIELNDESKNQKSKYFIDVLGVSNQIGQAAIIGDASNYYENELRVGKVAPQRQNFSAQNIITEAWVSVGAEQAYRYLIYAESQGFFTCIRQYYENASFKEEKVVFEQKTGEMLLDQAPKSIDKALANKNLREEYLLHHYSDLVSREGNKLKVKMYDGKTKVFVNNPPNGEWYTFWGFLDSFNAYVIHGGFYQAPGWYKWFIRRDGKEILTRFGSGGFGRLTDAYYISPEGDRILYFEEKEGGIEMNIIRAEDALIIVDECKMILPNIEWNPLFQEVSLDWIDNNKFIFKYSSEASPITYEYDGNTWKMK